MTFDGHDKPSLDSVLEHHGVKGMKWGVRKKLERASGNEAARLQSRDSKKATLGEKAHVGVIALAKNKGNVNKAALKERQKKIDHYKHVSSGKSSALKVLAASGSLSVRKLAKA